MADAYRSGSGPAQKARRAWTAWRYYRRPLELQVTDRCRHGRANAALDRLRNDVCVRLVPTRMVRERSGSTATPTRLDPDAGALIAGTRTLRRQLLDGHSYALIGGETFATTVFYDLCATQGGYD